MTISERFPSVNFFGMNPGIISSDIMSGVFGIGIFALKLQQTIMGMLFQSPEEYAQKIVPLLVLPEIENYSGIMFGRYGDPILSNPRLLEKSIIKKVIEESERLVNKALIRKV